MNGKIKNKMSTTMSLVTWKGTRVRNQTKAVLQMSQNEMVPSAEKSTN